MTKNYFYIENNEINKDNYIQNNNKEQKKIKLLKPFDIHYFKSFYESKNQIVNPPIKRKKEKKVNKNEKLINKIHNIIETENSNKTIIYNTNKEELIKKVKKKSWNIMIKK